MSGPSSLSRCIHCTGVTPCRRTISWNSGMCCEQCTVILMPRSRAAAMLSRISSGVQVSTCIGASMALSRPDGWLSAASTAASAVAKSRRPFSSVPDIVEAMAGRHEPAGIAIHRRSDGADAGVGQGVEPAVPGDREIGDRGAAALQQLGDGVLGRGLVGLELGRRAARLFGEARGHEHRLLVENTGL